MKDFQYEIFNSDLPFFSLKNNDLRIKEYRGFNFRITIKPSFNGLATMFDKDVWVYLILKMKNVRNKEKYYTFPVNFMPYNFFSKVHKTSGGKNYQLLKKSLSRLSGTIIRIEKIDSNRKKKIREFSFINGWYVINYKKRKTKFNKIKVIIPSWMIIGFLKTNTVYNFNEEYFKIRKMTDRRLYEIAEKFCNKKSQFSMNLYDLYLRSGSVGLLEMFKHSIKKISEKNSFPKYKIFLDSRKNLVFFSRI